MSQATQPEAVWASTNQGSDQYLPKPPTDTERDLYLGTQHRWVIFLSFFGYVLIVISVTFFVAQRMWAAWLLAPLAISTVGTIISLFTSSRRRRVSLKSHRELVENWVPDYVPSIDVFLPSAGEDLQVLCNTFYHVSRLQWPGALTVYVLNGWWYPWAESVNGNLPGDYVRAWRHVHGLFRSVGCINAQWVWSPNALTHSARGTTDLARLYPGDEYTDILGMTAYGHGSSAAQTFDPTLRSLRAIADKPILLSETGADGPTKTEWISSFGRYLQSNPDIIGFIWFNTSPSTTGASGDYRFDDSSQNVKAFRDALRTANVTSRTPATAVLGLEVRSPALR